MAAPKHNPQKDLQWLEQVDQQISESKKVDQSSRMKSLGWRNRAEELVTFAGTDGFPGLADLQAAAAVLDRVADALNPLASTTWKQEEVEACAERVRAYITLGMLDDEVVQRANELVATYTKMRSAKGTTKVYEDRPAKVVVLDTEGKEITTQTGNTENSQGNITGSIVRYLQGLNIEPSEEQRDLIRKAVRTSVVDGQSPVGVGDFATIVHKEAAAA